MAQQLETAQFFEPEASAELTGELACYARYVVGTEWDMMEDGSLGDRPNPWGIELFRTVEGVQPETSAEEAAYGKWLDQTTDRQSARQDRVHGAVGVIPTPLWIVLFAISFIIFGYMLFFADSAERAQGASHADGQRRCCDRDAPASSSSSSIAPSARSRATEAGGDGTDDPHHASGVRRHRPHDPIAMQPRRPSSVV